MLALMVTVQVVPLADEQPVHDEKAPYPTVAGADSVTVVPAGYLSAKLVLPPIKWLWSAGDAVMATPVDGFVELTVSVYD
jgi:hypothetical protein